MDKGSRAAARSEDRNSSGGGASASDGSANPIARAVCTVDEPVDLDTIARRDVALAIWRRSLPARLVMPMDLRSARTVRLLGDVCSLARDLPPALRDAGHDADLIDWLAQDIAAIALLHARLAGDERIAIRLEPIDTDSCRRFHADMVKLRTLCTYWGPGTEWREAAPDSQIERVPTGAVAMFRGRRLLEEAPILHRSPPIERMSGRRLILVVDTADERSREMYATDARIG